MTAAPVSNELRFTEDGRKIYEPDGAVLCEAVMDRSPVCGVRGPWGSGKSLMNFNKLWQIACEQNPSRFDGLRKTRWGVIRNTYPDLEGSTVKDFLEWFPEAQYGKMYWSRPLEYHMAVGDVRCEVVFLALDRDEDVRKLNSTQFTGFLFAEMQFTEKATFDDAQGRTGRYPSVAEGGSNWDGVLFDMNEPSEDHWIVQMTGEVPLPEDLPPEERAAKRWPKEWKYLVQPPALVEVFGPDGKTVTGYRVNPLAENLRWLKPSYYPEKVRGKDRRWIDSRLMNRISVYVDGKPVWSNFRVETHVAKVPLKPVPGYPIIMGMDFGRSPAVVFCQLISNRWYVLDECVAFGVDSTAFAPVVKRKLTQRFPGYSFRIYGDPKGRDQTQNSTTTSYDIFEAFDLQVQPAPVKNNNITERVEAVSFVLGGMHDGAPRMMLDPMNCPTLKVAMAGKYHYPKKVGGIGYAEEPKKDKYSNIADALQYAVLGEGEGRAMIGLSPQARREPVQAWKGRRSIRRVG